MGCAMVSMEVDRLSFWKSSGCARIIRQIIPVPNDNWLADFRFKCGAGIRAVVSKYGCIVCLVCAVYHYLRIGEFPLGVPPDGFSGAEIWCIGI